MMLIHGLDETTNLARDVKVTAGGAMKTDSRLPTLFKDYSSTAGANAATITPTSCRALYIKNLDDANSLQVSGDGGTTWVTIEAGDTLDIAIALVSFQIKRVGGADVAYRCVVTY